MARLVRAQCALFIWLVRQSELDPAELQPHILLDEGQYKQKTYLQRRKEVVFYVTISSSLPCSTADLISSPIRSPTLIGSP